MVSPTLTFFVVASAPLHRWLAVAVADASHSPTWLIVPEADVTTEADAELTHVADAAALNVTAKRAQDASGEAVPVSPGSAVCNDA